MGIRQVINIDEVELKLTKKQNSKAKKQESKSDLLLYFNYYHHTKSSRQSGEYWVDPDGVGVGSPPVRVHCDMRGGQGLTRVGHSLQGEHSISKCPEPGCAVYNVLYDLPIKQVTNLLYLTR